MSRRRAASGDPARSGSAGRASTQAQATPAPEAVGGRFERRRGRIGASLGGKLTGFFSQSDPDAQAWESLEAALLTADVGVAATEELIAAVKASVAAGAASPREALREALVNALDPQADRTLALAEPGAPQLSPIVVVGVNGVGKTTTVGKIARVLVADGHSVVLAAADTFRAAAADQLETWGAAVGVATVRSDRDGADPASVALEAAQKAAREGADVVLVDTAGRLQNKAGLMDQLGKIVRVIGKVAPPTEILLVLDATTGQNGLSQARVFAKAVPVTGIVLTKLDGSAKGGIVLGVQKELGVPVKLVGLGEGPDDLAPFEVEPFVDELLGTSD